MKYQSIPAFVFFVLLSSCAESGVKSDFDCPVNQGSGCASIGEADQASGGLDTRGKQSSGGAGAGEGGQASEAGANAAVQGYETPSLRVAERVGKIYVYGFIDASGNLHEGGYVHVVISEAGWK